LEETGSCESYAEKGVPGNSGDEAEEAVNDGEEPDVRRIWDGVKRRFELIWEGRALMSDFVSSVKAVENPIKGETVENDGA
jgi:hypothetical protein